MDEEEKKKEESFKLPSAEELIDSEVKSNKKSFQDGIRKNPWQVASVVLGIALLVLLVFFMSGGMTGNVISENDAGDKIVEFAKSRGADADLVEVVDMGSLYEVVVSVRGQEMPVYMTKDGDYLVSDVLPLNLMAEDVNSEEQVQELVKTDEPLVELFIMTHCPYGTQAEKGILSVFELLGNKIDASIRFVHYFMHGDEEEQETYNQLCIREEQADKYYDYLECFLEAGDSDGCLVEAGVDKTKLDSCVGNNAESYYADDSELSGGYGVGGSPSLVINGVQVDSARSPAGYLETICSAFITAPSECSQELSDASPSPGFGWGETGAYTDAQC